MNLLHRHQWTEVGRFFTGPKVGTRVKFATEELIERLAFGVTSVELHCECGDVSERQLLGNHMGRPNG